MTTHQPHRTTPPTSPRQPEEVSQDSTVLPQQSLGVSIALRLLPGAALTGFVLLTAPALSPALALFLGIAVVIAPIELGYLALYAHRTTGHWSPL